MTIGLFAPLPLAIMIPFMAAQSFAMGEAFGKSFQFGKRKISSMSNEEFNKLTAEQVHAEVQADITKMIPHMKASFETMEKFQSDVVNSIIKGIAETIGNLGGALTTSTSASSFDVSGSASAPPITDIRQGGRTAKFNIDAIVNTIEGIENAAIAYMEWAGITDFQEAKRKVKELIAAKNAPPPFVRKRIPVPAYIPLAQRQQVSKSNPQPAYLIEINSNIANYRAQTKTLLAKFLSANSQSYSNAIKKAQTLNPLRKQLQIAQSLLADWIKKGRNYQVLLKNR